MSIYTVPSVICACKIQYLPSIDNQREAGYDVAALVSRCGVASEIWHVVTEIANQSTAAHLAPEFTIRDDFKEQALGVRHIDGMCNMFAIA